jgi:type II secretory pathway component PulC
LPADIYKGIFISPRILKPLNRCLGVLVVIIGSYLIFELLFVRPYKNITPLIARAAAVTKPSSSRGGPAVSARRDYTAYAGDIKGKKIFSPPSAGGAPAQPPPMASTDISNEIGLVGVIQGDAPQAIIEDKRTQKTYYVSVSESFEGFIVEEIDGDKVIVTRDGKRMSISL